MRQKEVIRDNGALLAKAYPIPSGLTTTRSYLQECRSRAGGLDLLAEGKPEIYPLPVTWDGGLPHWRFRQNVARPQSDRFRARVHHCRIYGEGVVLTPDNRILRDVSEEFKYPQDDHALMHRTEGLPMPELAGGRLAVISSIAGAAYYHWLIDCMPRFGLIDERDVDAYYINVRSDFQFEFLQLLGVPEDRIFFATRRSHVLVPDLVLPSLPGLVGTGSDYTVDFLRAFASNFDAPRRKDRRIYISRSDATRRRVVNEDEVRGVLEKRGFEAVTLTGMAVADQMRLFREASVVAGPHGAGFANVAFAEPGASVVEFFHPSCVRLCFWRLSRHCRHRYGYLESEGDSPPEYEFPNDGNADLTVDARKLGELLDRMEVR